MTKNGDGEIHVLVTGSSGLVGSEAVRFYCDKGFQVFGIDNNMRKLFFGNDADTEWNRDILERTYPDNFHHLNMDIRNEHFIGKLFYEVGFDLIIHAASQPSHDWATKEPFVDFSINANGTLILLEKYRKYCPDAVFIFVSTNKVYGDTPNRLLFVEKETRFDLVDCHPGYCGISEGMSIDNSKHSLFGVSKLAGDLLVQEYGKYFGLNTGIFRCGCITGPAHSGTQLHGFLSYLVRCIMTGKKYTIFGYKGKQVRDNIHSYDLITVFDEYFKESVRGRGKGKGEVYNMGGSRHSNISILEAISEIEEISGKKANIEYIDESRIGDHIWYISDVSKFKDHYPSWNYKYDIHMILKELIESC